MVVVHFFEIFDEGDVVGWYELFDGDVGGDVSLADVGSDAGGVGGLVVGGFIEN